MRTVASFAAAFIQAVVSSTFLLSASTATSRYFAAMSLNAFRGAALAKSGANFENCSRFLLKSNMSAIGFMGRLLVGEFCEAASNAALRQRQEKFCRTCEKDIAPAVEVLGIQQVFSWKPRRYSKAPSASPNVGRTARPLGSKRATLINTRGLYDGLPIGPCAAPPAAMSNYRCRIG